MIPRERIFWKDFRLSTNGQITSVGDRSFDWEIGRTYRHEGFALFGAGGFHCTNNPHTAMRMIGGNAIAAVEAWGHITPRELVRAQFVSCAEYLRVLGIFSHAYIREAGLLARPGVGNPEVDANGEMLGAALLEILDRKGMLRPSIDVFDPDLELRSLRCDSWESTAFTYPDSVVVQTLPEIRSDLKIVAAQVVMSRDGGSFKPGDRVLVTIDRMRRIRPHDAFEVPIDDVIVAV